MATYSLVAINISPGWVIPHHPPDVSLRRLGGAFGKELSNTTMTYR
jgi:hypothetical protein